MKTHDFATRQISKLAADGWPGRGRSPEGQKGLRSLLGFEMKNKGMKGGLKGFGPVCLSRSKTSAP